MDKNNLSFNNKLENETNLNKNNSKIDTETMEENDKDNDLIKVKLENNNENEDKNANDSIDGMANSKSNRKALEHCEKKTSSHVELKNFFLYDSMGRKIFTKQNIYKLMQNVNYFLINNFNVFLIKFFFNILNQLYWIGTSCKIFVNQCKLINYFFLKFIFYLFFFCLFLQ